MPLTRVWKLYEHWQKQPPVHVLLAMFLEYGGKSTGSRADADGFAFPAQVLKHGALGVGGLCPQDQIHPSIRASVEQMQASPKYVEWRKALEARIGKP